MGGLGALSSRRRSRFAAPAVLLAGLLATGGAYAALAPANANADAHASSQSEIAKGRALFQVGCASCHGKNAEGIMTKRGSNFGPSLAGVGAAAVDFQVSTGRMPAAQPGVQIVKHRPTYSPSEIRALGAYIASLGPGPAVPSKAQTDISNLSTKEISEGGGFFRTNCTACHNFAGNGGALPSGRFAPKITQDTPRQIFEAMETGPQQMPVFSNDVVTPKEKRAIIGYVKSDTASTDYGGFSIGGLGPVTEGLVAWIVGIGFLVVVAAWIAAHTARSRKQKTEVDS
ncbi:MAG: cytochrome bc1 complex diheme cytochrome c subunit [Marmoricola sp.]